MPHKSFRRVPSRDTRLNFSRITLLSAIRAYLKTIYPGLFRAAVGYNLVQHTPNSGAISQQSYFPELKRIRLVLSPELTSHGRP